MRDGGASANSRSPAAVGGAGGQAKPRQDTLLAALARIAELHGRRFSAAAAVQGLPLRDGRLTIDLFDRAAQRLGFDTRIVRRKPSTVPGVVCPFIAIYRTGDAGVVSGLDRRAGRATVEIPGAGGPRRVTLGALDQDALDVAIYVADRKLQSANGRRAAPSGATGGHWLWGEIGRFLPTWTHVAITTLLVNLLGLALPLFVMNVYNRVIPYGAFPTLWALAIGVALALGFDFLLRMVRAAVIDNAGRRIDMKVSSRLYEQALDANMGNRPGRAGEFANHIREFESVREFFTSSSIASAIDLFFIGVFVACLWLVVGRLALVPIAAVPVVVLATLLIQPPLARAIARSMTASTSRHSVLVESMVGIEAVKASAAEGTFQKRWEEAVAGAVRAGTATRFWSSLAMHFTLFAQQVTSVAILAWGAYMVAAGDISIGALIAANLLAGRVLAPLAGIAMTLARANTSFSALKPLNALMALPGDHADPGAGAGVIANGAVELRDVDFAYRGQPARALAGVSLSIRPGERVGIIGRVASGKSTLGKLIAGLYRPDGGALILDGADIRQYWMADVRRAVAYVGQEPELFSGSVRDNILLGRAEDPAVFEACAGASGVAAFVNSHPAGYALQVGERGQSLSGGQRQSVAIARALAGDPVILFLDEPTSAMDTTTEAAFIERFGKWLTPGRTLLVATHRSTMLALVDRLIVLDKGRIVADGPKGEVLRRLAKRQEAAGKAGKRGGAGGHV